MGVNWSSEVIYLRVSDTILHLTLTMQSTHINTNEDMQRKPLRAIYKRKENLIGRRFYLGRVNKQRGAESTHHPIRVETPWRFIISNYYYTTTTTIIILACYVADMLPTRVNVAKSWLTLRVVATQKSPQHTQFTADNYKTAKTYGYPSYNRVFVFELKQQSRNYRHVGCRESPDMSSNVMSFWTPCRHDIFLCLRHDQRRVATCRRHDTECCRLGNKNDTPTSDITG